MIIIPPRTITSIFGSPTDWYSSAATAARDKPPTSSRDGAGGIASCRSTRSGGVFLSCMSDGKAKPNSKTIALPLPNKTGPSPGSGRSP